MIRIRFFGADLDPPPNRTLQEFWDLPKIDVSGFCPLWTRSIVVHQSFLCSGAARWARRVGGRGGGPEGVRAQRCEAEGRFKGGSLRCGDPNPENVGAFQGREPKKFVFFRSLAAQCHFFFSLWESSCGILVAIQGRRPPKVRVGACWFLESGPVAPRMEA